MENTAAGMQSARAHRPLTQSLLILPHLVAGLMRMATNASPGNGRSGLRLLGEIKVSPYFWAAVSWLLDKNAKGDGANRRLAPTRFSA